VGIGVHIGPRLSSTIGLGIGGASSDGDSIILLLGDSIVVGTGNDALGNGSPLWFSVDTEFNPVTLASHQALSPTTPPFSSEIGPTALVAYAPGAVLAFGPEVMLGRTANTLSSRFGYIVKAGIGGSLLDTHWNPTGTFPAAGAGNLLNTEIARAQAYEASTGRRVRIIYVNLLTNDAGDAGASSRVAANMTAMVAALHAVWPNASIVWPLIHVGTVQANTATVRTAQLSYASTAPDYFKLLNIDRYSLQDALHPDTTAVLDMGKIVAYQGADMQSIAREAATTTPRLIGQGVPVFANGASPTLTPLPDPGTLDADTTLAFCLTNSTTPGGGAGTQTISCSAGWTLVAGASGQVTAVGFTTTWAVYKRTVPNGEVGTNTVPPSVDAAAAPPTFTIANGGDSLAQVFSVRGPTAGNQDVDASQVAVLNSFGTGPFTIPTWTTTADQDLVLYIVGGAGSVGNSSTLTAAGVTGLTKLGESLFSFSSGDTVTWALYVGTRPTHGAIGTASLSFAINTLVFASALAIKP
jgi:hypothetical protein